MSLESFIMLIILPVLALGILLALCRLALGPDLPDRVVALDVIATQVICMAAAYAIATDNTSYLDTAMVLALVTFLGTVAFAYYIHRRSP